MSPKRRHFLHQLYNISTQAVVCIGSIICLLGVIAPWAQTKIFCRFDISLPGALFVNGSIVLACASICLLLRRFRIATLILATVAFITYTHSLSDIPRDIKSRIIAGQSSLSPINRLLDQANIPNIVVGNFALADEAYLGYGLDLTRDGIIALALGSIAGLGADPLISLLWMSYAKTTCKNCSTQFPIARNADYCPTCGTWQHDYGEPLRCPFCQTNAQSTDTHCIHCGNMLKNTNLT